MWAESRRRLLRLALALLGLSLFGLVLYVGGAEAWRQVLRADPLWVGVAFLCTALLTYVSAARWGLLANAVAGHRICSTRAYYNYMMIGKTVGLVLSEAVGVYAVGPLAMKAGGQSSFALAAGSMLLDKLFDLGLSGLLLLPTAFYALGLIGLETCALFFGLVIVLLAVLLRGWYAPLVALAWRLRQWAAARAGRVPLLRRALHAQAAQRLMALQAEQVPSRRVALIAYGLTVLRYGLMAARFAAVSYAVRVAVPPLLIWVGIPIAQLGLLLAVTPGALGALEAGWLGVLLLAGLPRQDIATFLIGQRAALFVFIFVLGAISYLGSLVFPFRSDDGRMTRHQNGIDA
jgi:uncharacterized protein (TIRG00374 family)